MKPLSDTKVLNLGKYFYKLAERSQDVFWIRDKDYKTYLYISPAFKTVWGLSCEALYASGDIWFDAIHPDDKQQFTQTLELVKSNPQEGQTNSQEYRIMHADKQEVRRIQEVSFPVYDTNKQLIGFAGIAKDITREAQRLAELEQAIQFLKFFAKRVPAVFWARDATCTKQLYLSPGYEKVWERSRKELYDDPGSWLDTLHSEDREKVSNVSRFQQLANLGESVEYENRYRIHTPSGEIRWIKDTSYPIFDKQNNFMGFAGIAENITKEVLHELELREAKQRAEVANQAKSDFLAMVSHELRTPLNAILGMAQILHTKQLTQEQREFVGIISNAGNHLLALVSDILDFARLEAGKLSFICEPFSLHELAEQIVQSMQYQAKDKHIDLLLECTGISSVPVLGDANRIRQVFVNLLNNALKFTEQGHINVKIDCQDTPPDAVLFTVAVTDTGIGIEQDKLLTIFDRFSQVDSIYHRKHSGIGLGLAITKQLVETMGGSIRATSEINQGSTFTFHLTLKRHVERTNKHIPPVDEMVQQVQSRQYGLHLLLVEDNPINQRIAQVMLENLGCRIDIVENGMDVLNRMHELDHYDLIFMDVGLPDLSGFDVVSRLRQVPALKRKPIVAMTAHILDRDKQQAFESGMDCILAKPISYVEMISVLDLYANGKK